jgi:hypothetical protein
MMLVLNMKQRRNATGYSPCRYDVPRYDILFFYALIGLIPVAEIRFHHPSRLAVTGKHSKKATFRGPGFA